MNICKYLQFCKHKDHNQLINEQIQIDVKKTYYKHFKNGMNLKLYHKTYSKY